VRPVVRDLEHADAYPEKLTHVSAQCYAAVTEELARGWMSLAGTMGGHTVVAKLLLTFGTREQQDTWRPKMATGEVRATMALTEPGGGSDLQAMRTVARRTDAGYVVDGSKTWITNARRSQFVALLCKTDPAARCDMEAGMAKLFASETAMEIALNAVRIHGGYGYSTEFDAERYFRDAPLMIVGEGTHEIQRNVIARQLISRNRR
jgi:alkylation response protein AidB-like acyl-CoA dehydrogenase